MSMFNEFLTTTLQVVIAMNVAGLIAYFCLGSRRRQTPTPALQRQPVATTRSLWNKLIQPCRGAIGRPQRSASVVSRLSETDTLEASLGRLRRVLDGYGSSLT